MVSIITNIDVIDLAGTTLRLKVLTRPRPPAGRAPSAFRRVASSDQYVLRYSLLLSPTWSFHVRCCFTSLLMTRNFSSALTQNLRTSRCTDILNICSVDVLNWFTHNGLSLNPSKTEVLIMEIRKMVQRAGMPSIPLAGCDIKRCYGLKSLGVILVEHLSFENHVSDICRSKSFHIRSLDHVWRFITTDMAKTVASAIVYSKLDYCNQGRNYHWTRVDKVQGAPECRGPPSSRQIFSRHIFSKRRFVFLYKTHFLKTHFLKAQFCTFVNKIQKSQNLQQLLELDMNYSRWIRQLVCCGHCVQPM